MRSEIKLEMAKGNEDWQESTGFYSPRARMPLQLCSAHTRDEMKMWSEQDELSVVVTN